MQLLMPMGFKCSPDIAQAAMENALSDIEDANVYIDEVGAVSNDWDHHVNLLATFPGSASVATWNLKP